MQKKPDQGQLDDQNINKQQLPKQNGDEKVEKELGKEGKQEKTPYNPQVPDLKDK